MEIKIKKLHPNAVIPEYATAGAAGFDLVTVEDISLMPGETKLIPIGLAFEIPEGYEMQIRPRSGLSLRTKLRQSTCIGTIDSDYRGEVRGMFDNISESDTYLIRKGDRIAQAVIAPVVRAEFTVVDELSETKRGAGGFGHTGVQMNE